MSFLDYVRIENVGPFDLTTVPLDRVTFLVGANGSGKTSVLRSLLAGVSPSELEKFEGKRNSRVYMRFKDTDDSREYRSSANGSGMDNNTSVLTSDHMSDVYRRWLQGVQLYDFRAKTGDAGPVGSSVKLDPSCRNLFTVVDNYRDARDGTFERLEKMVRDLVPAVDGLTLQANSQGTKTVCLINGRGDRIPYRQMSTGTQFIIAMATFLVSRPDLTCLLVEEPETGLHPAAQLEVAGALSRLVTDDERESELQQVIMTTHSPFVYSAALRDAPERIVILSQGEHGIEAIRLSEMETWESLRADQEFMKRYDTPLFFTQ